MTPTTVRPLAEQTILVTGATDGLGRHVARQLAGGGATVLVHGRDPERGKAVMAEVREAGGGTGGHALYLADFSSLDEVRRLAHQVEADHDRLDVLVNNAGLGAASPGGRRQLSVDGHELRFQVNYLSGFLLTGLLLGLLRRSAAARIVNVASIGQAPLDFDDLMLERGYDGWRAYRQSKLAQVMFTVDLARLLEGTGVTVNALHPATLMDTKMVREVSVEPMSTVEEGAAATLRLAAAPELKGVTGRFFHGMREADAHPQASDAGARRRLWAMSDELAGIRLSVA